jgi:eukaryotic-like serine/threonine-protein kinase
MGNSERLIEIFTEAQACLTEAERQRFVGEACGGDNELKQQVLSLLQVHDRAGDFLQPTPIFSSATLIAEKPGDRIGRYKLLEQIGEGGCGVVYMAEQQEPVRRRVALKVIKLGMDTKQVIARFEAERQALALMEHPNIAKVLDGGATDTGRPFFVMELVRGIKITDYCDQNNLSTKERLELFIQVCQAIQHAHQKGIIHRDIKPSNILVTQHDDVAVPKVIDFGIAKATIGQLTDKTVFTAFAHFIGTPAYMSPEQAQMSGLDIDTRADIYSLGVLLYELLTGNTPFDAKELLAAGMDEMRRKIREDEPAKPSTCLSTMTAMDLTMVAKQRHAEPPKLIHLIRGDLDWLVMKCLEKDRTRRYETANALAIDLQRHLSNEPVVARPASNLYRFQKLVRRNKLAFGAGFLVIAVLLLGSAVSTWQAIRATKAEGDQARLRTVAEEALKTARRHEEIASASAKKAREQQELAVKQEVLARRRYYAAQMNLAMQAWDAHQPARALDLLETQRPKSAEQEVRGFEWFHLWGLCHARLRFAVHGNAREITKVVFSPDGKYFAAGGGDGSIGIWESAEGRQKFVLRPETPSSVMTIAFAPDGRTLVSGEWDGMVRLWDASTGKLRATLTPNIGRVSGVAISADGKILVTGGKGDEVKLWDFSSGVETASFSAGHASISTLACSHSGMLATASGYGGSNGELVKDETVKLWNLTERTPQSTLEFPGARALAFSPDGKSLAAVGTRNIYLWDTDTGQLRSVIKEHPVHILSLALLRDGTLLTGSEERTIRAWRLKPAPEESTEDKILGTHLESVSSLAVSEDETTLASGALDGSIKVWNLSEPAEGAEARFATTFQCAPEIVSILPLARSNAVFISSRDGTEIRDLASGQKIAAFPQAMGCLALSPDGTTLASATLDGQIRLWEVATGRELEAFQAHLKAFAVPALAFSPDGQTLATTSVRDPGIKLWNVQGKVPLLENLRQSQPIGVVIALGGKVRLLENLRQSAFGVGAVAISSDGKKLAAALRFGHLAVIDLPARKLEQQIVLGGGAVGFLSVTFSPDGAFLAIAGDGGTAQIWNVQTGQLHAALRGHTARVSAIAFSPDGSTVATGGDDKTVRLWDVATGQERVTFTRHIHQVRSLAFLPDGNTLVSGDRSGTVWVLRRPALDKTEEVHLPLVDAK